MAHIKVKNKIVRLVIIGILVGILCLTSGCRKIKFRYVPQRPEDPTDSVKSVDPYGNKRLRGGKRRNNGVVETEANRQSQLRTEAATRRIEANRAARREATIKNMVENPKSFWMPPAGRVYVLNTGSTATPFEQLKNRLFCKAVIMHEFNDMSNTSPSTKSTD